MSPQRKRKADEQAGDVADKDLAAETEDAAEAPAPKRRRRAKAKPQAAAEAKAKAETPTAASSEDAPAEKPKPARKRTPAKADAEAPAPRPRRASQRPTGEPPLVRAQARYVRSSARKARLVCDHIRGKPVPEARAILAFSSRDVARAWSKLLESAVANAEHNHELDGDELRVVAAFADEGPTIKRFRPRAMGRATRIRKRTSHLSITLVPKE
jgi:ribosomal protein L22